MALIVIATKLLFPFDSVKRYPTTSNEPAAQIMDWNIWAQAHRQFDSHDRPDGEIGKGNAIHVTDKDVLNMTPGQMDQYMDWYANSWLDNSRGKECRCTMKLHLILIMYSYQPSRRDVPCHAAKCER